MSNANVNIQTQIPLQIFYFSWTCSFPARLFSKVTVHFQHTQRNKDSKLPVSLSTLVIICLVCHGHFGGLFWLVFHGLQDQFSFPPTMNDFKHIPCQHSFWKAFWNIWGRELKVFWGTPLWGLVPVSFRLLSCFLWRCHPLSLPNHHYL